MLNNIICNKIINEEKERFFFQSVIFGYLLVWLEKERNSNLIYQKTLEQVSTLGDYLILEMRIQSLKIQLLIL